MENMATYVLDIPNSDLNFFKSFVKKMGWSAKKQKTTSKGRLDEAIKDFETGNVKSFDIVNDLMDYLNS